MKVWICQQTGRAWVAQDANGSRIIPPGLVGYGNPPSTPGPVGYGQMPCLLADVDADEYEPAPGELVKVARRSEKMHSGRIIKKTPGAAAPQLAFQIDS